MPKIALAPCPCPLPMPCARARALSRAPALCPCPCTVPMPLPMPYNTPPSGPRQPPPPPIYLPPPPPFPPPSSQVPASPRHTVRLARRAEYGDNLLSVDMPVFWRIFLHDALQPFYCFQVGGCTTPGCAPPNLQTLSPAARLLLPGV